MTATAERVSAREVYEKLLESGTPEGKLKGALDFFHDNPDGDGQDFVQYLEDFQLRLGLSQGTIQKAYGFAFPGTGVGPSRPGQKTSDVIAELRRENETLRQSLKEQEGQCVQLQRENQTLRGRVEDFRKTQTKRTQIEDAKTAQKS